MSDLIYEVADLVATLTINRPERRNALSAEVIELMLKQLDEAESDPAVRVIVLTGAGEKAFCAGADLGGGVGGHGTANYARLLKRLVHFPKPTVARINGYCLAGGMGLMLACDIVIAHSEAKFGTPEVNVGLWPSMISALIYRNMLPKRALPMILLGERFGVKQAYEMGFLSEVVDVDELDDRVAAVAQILSAKSPIGMKLGKASYLAMQDMPLDAALDFLSGELAKVASTEDAAEGIAAFMEKRKPEFKGV
ncbi:MAG: enoyl-CoA hydratase-related protein [Ardenticatenaceae bacterium]|nr:enoyl-CoA hydratase-related protein [Ardenticatenaceae bacterium]